jgi:group I intron endonuclease
MGRIYLIFNDINEKAYIGKTLLTIEDRFNIHKKDMNKRKYEKRPLYNAMRKYGVEKFHIKLIEDNISITDLSDREIF